MAAVFWSHAPEVPMTEAGKPQGPRILKRQISGKREAPPVSPRLRAGIDTARGQTHPVASATPHCFAFQGELS